VRAAIAAGSTQIADKLAATEHKYLEEIAMDDHRHPPELLATAARGRREVHKDHPGPEGGGERALKEHASVREMSFAPLERQ